MTMRFMMLVKHAEKSEAPPKEFIDAMTILAKRRSKPEPFAGVVDLPPLRRAPASGFRAGKSR